MGLRARAAQLSESKRGGELTTILSSGTQQEPWIVAYVLPTVGVGFCSEFYRADARFPKELAWMLTHS